MTCQLLKGLDQKKMWADNPVVHQSQECTVESNRIPLQLNAPSNRGLFGSVGVFESGRRSHFYRASPIESFTSQNSMPNSTFLTGSGLQP